MDSVSQYGPHKNAAFEGYYSNFELSDGGRIILIICTVRKAKDRPHMICFMHFPKDHKNRKDVYHKEIWVDRFDMTDQHSTDGGFLVDTSGGRFTFNRSSTDFHINCPELRLEARIDNTKRLKWLPGHHDTPEGILALLPLPLHWQVYSLSSPAEISWDLKDSSTGKTETSGQNSVSHVHQEKNWATSFPSAHTWIQARQNSGDGKSTSGISVAGGSILGLHA